MSLASSATLLLDGQVQSSSVPRVCFARLPCAHRLASSVMLLGGAMLTGCAGGSDSGFLVMFLIALFILGAGGLGAGDSGVLSMQRWLAVSLYC